MSPGLKRIIAPADVRALVQKLEQEGLESLFLRSWLQMSLLVPGLIDLESDRVFVLEGDWETAGQVAVATVREDFEVCPYYHLYCSKDHPLGVEAVVARLLEETLDSSRPIVFEGIPDYLEPVMVAFLEAQHPGSVRVSLPRYVLTLANGVPDLVAPPANRALPPTAEVRPLTEEHAKVVGESWHFSDSSTPVHVAHIIKHGLGQGVFVQGELVAWGLTVL